MLTNRFSELRTFQVNILLVRLSLPSFGVPCRLSCFGVVSCYCCFSAAIPWFSNTSRLPLLSRAMDHAQGRAFHHHLARAIMHLNYLAGLLPFFEPSIEFDDGATTPPFHGESQSHRGLHTFVPLPVASAPPSLVSWWPSNTSDHQSGA